MWRHFKSTMNLLNTFRGLASLVFLLFLSSTVYAEVCVWRNPERTMTKIFPEARDYESVDAKISAEKLKLIEKRSGRPLDSGERGLWIYYGLKGNNAETLGYILTDAEKGEYGVIEIIVGVTPGGKVKGVYIQRAREKNKEFKSKEFLEQFIGKTKDDTIQIGKDIKAQSVLATEEVAYGVRKMLVMYDELRKRR